MNYVIVTTEWCEGKGIIVPANARKSLDGTKVIFHEDFVKPVLGDGETVDVYAHNSAELNEILNGEEWSEKEKEANGTDIG